MLYSKTCYIAVLSNHRGHLVTLSFAHSVTLPTWCYDWMLFALFLTDLAFLFCFGGFHLNETKQEKLSIPKHMQRYNFVRKEIRKVSTLGLFTSEELFFFFFSSGLVLGAGFCTAGFADVGPKNSLISWMQKQINSKVNLWKQIHILHSNVQKTCIFKINLQIFIFNYLKNTVNVSSCAITYSFFRIK